MFFLDDYNLSASFGGPLALSQNSAVVELYIDLTKMNLVKLHNQGAMKLVGTCRNQLTDMDQFITF